MPNCAIIVAAGAGRRFGGPKQFYPFRGKPLFLYALDTFKTIKDIDYVTIVVPKNKINYTKNLIKKFSYKKVRYIIPGGKRRQDSVYRGIQTIKGNGIAIIHDGVRPIVSKGFVRKGIRLCKKYSAVIFGMPIKDTIKQVNRNTVLKTIPRNGLYLIQTPQFFNIELLRNVYKNRTFHEEFTDEASIIEESGFPVYLFVGDPCNIKITTKDDLKILGKFIK